MLGQRLSFFFFSPHNWADFGVFFAVLIEKNLLLLKLSFLLLLMLFRGKVNFVCPLMGAEIFFAFMMRGSFFSGNFLPPGNLLVMVRP